MAAKTGTSRFRGVTRCGITGRYRASVRVERRRVELGAWIDETDAAIARDRAALWFALDTPLNLPARSKRLGPASAEELHRAARRASRTSAKTASSSPFFGVVWNKRRAAWDAYVCVGDERKVYISKFDRAEDAAVAYDRVARSLFGQGALLNFSEADHAPATIAEMQAWSRALRAARPREAYIGVARKPGGRFEAIVRHEGGRGTAGTYANERDAAIARDRAVLFLGTGDVLNEPTVAKELGGLSPTELRRLARLPKKRETSSRYFGVHYAPKQDRWLAALVLERGDGSRIIGEFATELEAAEAYDRAARHQRGADTLLNFPERELVPTSVPDLKEEAFRRRKSQTRSRYVGVFLDHGGTTFRWAGKIELEGREVHLGGYRTEREAAIAYDRAALHFRGSAARLNFPKISRGLGPAAPDVLRAAAWEEFKKTTTSQYRGVHWDRHSERWRAGIGHQRRWVHLGSFADEIAAACAYDVAARRLHKKKAKPNFSK